MSEDQTHAAVRELHRAETRRDLARFAELLADDIDWRLYFPVEVFPFAGARKGKAEAIEALDTMMKDYAVERFVPEIVIVEGDRAAVLADVAFVQRASGRTLRFRLAQFLRFRAGLVVELFEFGDSFDVTCQALGRWLEV